MSAMANQYALKTTQQSLMDKRSSFLEVKEPPHKAATQFSFIPFKKINGQISSAIFSFQESTLTVVPY
jgi:hypothetical protein